MEESDAASCQREREIQQNGRFRPSSSKGESEKGKWRTYPVEMGDPRTARVVNKR